MTCGLSAYFFRHLLEIQAGMSFHLFIGLMVQSAQCSTKLLSYSTLQVPSYPFGLETDSCLVFNFLWRAKRMEYILSHGWSAQMQNARMLKKVPGETHCVFVFRYCTYVVQKCLVFCTNRI